MLKRLYISNFKLIDQLLFEPHRGFSVITGETGAGKSIILGALGLILGNRSDGADLFNPESKCILEANFRSNKAEIAGFLKANDFDLEEELIIRREILPSGKSRSFINDTPARLNQLSELGQHLINVHTQHGHLDLKNPVFILNLLDAFAGIQDKVQAYGKVFREFQSCKKEIEEVRATHNQLLLDRDYFQFLFDELNELQPVDGELSGLEEELSQLQHAEEIQMSISKAQSAFDEEGMLIANLQQAENLLNQVADYSNDIDALMKRIRESRIELEDVRSELDAVSSKIEYNPERIEVLTERVNAINHLLHKHHFSQESELLQKMEELEGKLQSFGINEEELKRLESKLEELSEKIQQQGSEIRESRTAKIPDLATAIEKQINSLGIKNGRVGFDMSPLEQADRYGLDQVKMVFSANIGKDLKDVSQVASGGELSRIMLSIKSILAEKDNLPSIVFDEIDTGVSGEVANQMGSIMQNMASKMQVISITHLPQVAAKGSEHYAVIKQITEGKTQTQLLPIAGEDRVIELAKMLSGDNVSQVAKENARFLLDN